MRAWTMILNGKISPSAEVFVEDVKNYGDNDTYQSRLLQLAAYTVSWR